MDWISRRGLLDRSVKVIGGLSLGMILFSGSSRAYADVDLIDDGEKTKTSPKTKKVKTTNNKKKSLVVKITNRKAVDSSGSGKECAVFDMITKGIRELTGEKDDSKTWQTMASEGQRVGIKVNCIAGRNMSTQVPVVMAIIEGLKSAGVRERDLHYPLVQIHCAVIELKVMSQWLTISTVRNLSYRQFLLMKSMF